jgi:hypothetical protein
LRKYFERVFFSTGFAVLVAFVLRILVFRSYLHEYDDKIVRDFTQFGAETGAVAASIARGQGFSSPLGGHVTGPTAWFAPLYPYLLAGVFKLWGVFSYPSDLAIHFINLAISSFTCWPIAAIGDRAFGKKTGAAAAWFWVVLPNAIYFPVVWVWDTALAAFWMALLVAVTLKLRGSSRMRDWLCYGALWAVGGLINPSLLAVLPFLAIWAIWPLRRDLTQATKLAVASALLFAAMIAPWSVRNYVVFHHFVPLRSNFGLELWLGNNPDVTDTCSCSLHPTTDESEAAKYAQMTEIPYMEQKQSEALAFMRTHPVDTLRFTFRRFEDTWLGVWDAPADVWRSSHASIRALVVFNCSFSLLALCGVLAAFRSQNDAATPLGAVLMAFPAVFYLTHPSSRYRFPMDPIMLVLATYALGALLASLPLGRRNTASSTTQPLAQGTD